MQNARLDMERIGEDMRIKDVHVHSVAGWYPYEICEVRVLFHRVLPCNSDCQPGWGSVELGLGSQRMARLTRDVVYKAAVAI